MSDNPRATLLVTSCDQQSCVGASVEAALEQRGAALEIIISDDASTDGSLEVIRAAVAGYAGPHRVRVRSNPRRLGRDHFTLLVEEAAADFIIMSHADDRMAPDRCAKLLEAHERTGASLVISTARMIDDAGREIGLLRPVPLASPQALSAFERLGRSGTLEGYIGATMGWHRELYALFPRLDTVYVPSGHDHLLTMRATFLNGIALIEEPLLSYRYGGTKWHLDFTATPDGEEEVLRFASLALAAAIHRDLEHLSCSSPQRVLPEWRRLADAYGLACMDAFVLHRARLLQTCRPTWLPRGAHEQCLRQQGWLQVRWFLQWVRRRWGGWWPHDKGGL